MESLDQSPNTARHQSVSLRRRLGAVAHALTGGKRGTPLDVAAVVPSASREERRTPQQEIKRIALELGVPKNLHGQSVAIPEHIGPRDRNGNNMVATFELPGKGGEPVGFSLVRRQDGLDPVSAANGYPPEWRNYRRQQNVPTVTVVPTACLPLIGQMNGGDVTASAFYDLQERVPHMTIRAGEEMQIGRTTFPELLGNQTSLKHMTVGLTERQSADYQDAKVIIADHSANGTDNVTALSGSQFSA